MKPQPQNSAEALAVIRKLNKKQQDVLGACAIGLDGGHPRQTLEALERKGLLERCDERHADRLGTLIVFHWSTPIFVHIAWCEWAAEQPDEEEGETPAAVALIGPLVGALLTSLPAWVGHVRWGG